MKTPQKKKFDFLNDELDRFEQDNNLDKNDELGIDNGIDFNPGSDIPVTEKKAKEKNIKKI